MIAIIVVAVAAVLLPAIATLAIVVPHRFSNALQRHGSLQYPLPPSFSAAIIDNLERTVRMGRRQQCLGVRRKGLREAIAFPIFEGRAMALLGFGGFLFPSHDIMYVEVVVVLMTYIE